MHVRGPFRTTGKGLCHGAAAVPRCCGHYGLPVTTPGPAAVRSTPRLRLRPLRLDDLEALCAVETDPATNRHRPAGPPTRDEVEERLRGSVQAWQDDGVGYWAVEHEGQLVGVAGLRPLELHRRACWNLYYRLRPASWGRGLAAEAARETVAFGGELDPLVPVVARTRPGNLAAQEVAERAGLMRRADLDADGFHVHARGW